MNTEHLELKAGTFLMIGLILFVVAILLLGQERQIFTRQVEFYTKFKDVKGLAEGAPVRLGGITVGRVADVGFSPDLKDQSIEVRLLVNNNSLNRIRSDAKVSLQTAGLLGDQYIHINPGRDNTELAPGSTIASIEAGNLSDVMQKAGKVVDSTVEIADNVNDFVKKLNADALSNFSDTFTNLNELTGAVKTKEGFLHRLIYSEGSGNGIMKNLEQASKNLNDVTKQVRRGDGLLHALLYSDDGDKTIFALTDAAEKISKSADHIAEIAKEIKDGNGLIHNLIFQESPEGLDQIVARFNKTAENLEKASAAIAQGNGTLGALLIDSQLYDNLVEATDGAKRSFVLRQAIRNSYSDTPRQ